LNTVYHGLTAGRPDSDCADVWGILTWAQIVPGVSKCRFAVLYRVAIAKAPIQMLGFLPMDTTN